MKHYPLELEDHPVGNEANVLIRQNWRMLNRLFNPAEGFTASQTGTTVTADAALFTDDNIGDVIVFDSGETGTITAVGSAVTPITTCTLDISQTVASVTFQLYNAGEAAGDQLFRGLVKVTQAANLRDGDMLRWSGMKVERVRNNLTATTAPGVGDDADDGYDIGSAWYDLTADVIYFCLDSTVGAAVWVSAAVGTGSVTNDKLADMAANTVKARAQGTTGVPEDLAIAASQIVARLATGNLIGATLTQILDMATGTAADGDILIRSGGAWILLAKGSDGEILKLAAGLPGWAPETGGAAALLLDGTTVMTGVIKAALGTAALPGIAFDGDLDTGIFSAGANRLGLCQGGQMKFEIHSIEAEFNTHISASAGWTWHIGTTAAPFQNIFGSKLHISDGTEPATPASGDIVVYALAADGKLYCKNDVGTVYDLTAGGGGGMADLIDDVTPSFGGPVDTDLTFVKTANRLIEILAATTGAGKQLTLKAGNADGAGTNGGKIILQGGSDAGGGGVGGESAVVGGDGATGGAASLKGGDGDTAGGDVNIAGGTPMTGQGGDVNIDGGSGETAGAINIRGGDDSMDTGKTTLVRGGSSSSGSNDGGKLELRGGNDDGALNQGGDVHVAGGSGGTDGDVILARDAAGTNRGKVGIGVAAPAEMLDVLGNIKVSGTVDGRDVATDGTKLDGIESSATADQSNAEIETAYNAQVGEVSEADARAGVSTTNKRWTAKKVRDAIEGAPKTHNLTVEDPVVSEDISWFYTDVAITITQLVIVLRGSATPSLTVDIRHSTDRSAAGNALITSPSATTNTTTGHKITVFNDATIPAGSFVWIETDAQSGTVDEALFNVKYTED